MTDPVTAYARDVKAGRIIAGPHVRDACDRHLRDLKRKGTEAFPCQWNPLPKREKGETPEERRARGPAFKLEPWQAFVGGSLFGWIGPDGFRRFRTA